MDTKFTPGPWMADGSDMSMATWVYGADRKRICTMIPGEKDWANARLIAAAPELYAALAECITESPGAACFNTGKKTRRLEAINATVRAVLAKVKG